VAAFGAPAADDFPASGSGHSKTEAVFDLPPADIGLKRSFHCLSPKIDCGENGLPTMLGNQKRVSPQHKVVTPVRTMNNRCLGAEQAVKVTIKQAEKLQPL